MPRMWQPSFFADIWTHNERMQCQPNWTNTLGSYMQHSHHTCYTVITHATQSSHMLRVDPNRMTVFTPYPRYAVYPVPYMTLSHRFRNRMTVYGFWPTVYTPYVRSKPPYMDRICRWCRVRFPATAIFFALFGHFLFSNLFFPSFSFASLFYWCMFCINN